MKKHISTIALIMIFLIGLSVLLYPSVSNYINQIDATEAVGNYDQHAEVLDDETAQNMLAAAEAYNLSLLENPAEFINGEPKEQAYKALLDLTGNGIMGSITIQRIGVNLPIYHGTSEDVLSKAVGHIEGSSLPVGGRSTHVVLSGHRGLPAAKLFTDLDQLELGDTFTIKVLKETLTYEVDDIKIVLPEEIADIGIIPGEDYVTLITCTPYAVNTHRLLVRGKRIETAQSAYVPTDAVMVGTEIVLPVVITPFFVTWVLIALFGSGKKKIRR